jgi:hypothetical protein
MQKEKGVYGGEAYASLSFPHSQITVVNVILLLFGMSNQVWGRLN